MRRKIRIALWSILGLVILVYVASGYILICIDKGRHYYMENIAVGVIHYSDMHSRLPASLDELASDHFLPSRSDNYACPLQNGRFFFLPKVDLTNVQYEIDFNRTNVVIRFQPGVRKFLRWVVIDKDLPNLDLTIGPNDSRMSVPRDHRFH